MTESNVALRRLVIVGVGLIGGSVARAARARGMAREIVGVGRNRDRLEAARLAGVIDRGVTSCPELQEADLVVVCTPPDRISADVLEILDQTTSSTFVTDAGSVKGEIVRAVETSPQAGRFLGSHPLAGSHLAGFEHATADLFQNRICVLTPTPRTSTGLLSLVGGFWRQLGMQVVEMSPEDHDRALAKTSHLPHLAASSLAAQLDETLSRFAATGFRDTTRIAGGDADLWTAIFLMNADHLAAATGDLIRTLQDYRGALEQRDRERIAALLRQGRAGRDLIGE